MILTTMRASLPGSPISRGLTFRNILLTGLLLALSCGPGFALGLSDSLSALNKRIVRDRKSLEQLERKESKLTTDLSRLDEMAARQSELSLDMDGKVRLLDKRIAQMTDTLATLSAAYQQTCEMAARRATILYRRGRLRDLEIIFSAESFSDLIRRIRFVRYLAARDALLLASLRHQREVLQAASDSLLAARNDLTQSHRTALLESDKARRLFTQRQQSITQVRKDRSRYANELNALEASARELSDLIDKAQTRVDSLPPLVEPPTGAFTAQRGRLAWPCLARKVKNKFGIRTNPQTHSKIGNDGVDIQTASGSPVVAVYPGRVAYEGYLRGLGRFVILQHAAGYYTVYAHLETSEVSQGQEIGPGQLVGRSGETGSLEGPMLHFEIRQGKKPLDPLNWLRKS